MEISPVDTTLLPADVRTAGPKARQLYEAALGFEQIFVSQLGSTLADSVQAGADGGGDDGTDGGDGGDGVSSFYAQMLPDALGSAVAGQGGLGLADQLYRSLALGAGT